MSRIIDYELRHLEKRVQSGINWLNQAIPDWLTRFDPEVKSDSCWNLLSGIAGSHRTYCLSVRKLPYEKLHEMGFVPLESLVERDYTKYDRLACDFFESEAKSLIYLSLKNTQARNALS